VRKQQRKKKTEPKTWGKIRMPKELPNRRKKKIKKEETNQLQIQGGV